jgi:hypothetical protein
MNPYHYKLSLRIRHPAIDPARISEALRITPSRSWRAGEPRATPKGNPLAGKWDHSYWTAGISEDQSVHKTLKSAIREALDRLAPHRDFFHQMRSDGGTAEFFVGWFFDRNSGDIFNYDLLARAADLKIDLSFDVYPSEISQQIDSETVKPHTP